MVKWPIVVMMLELMACDGQRQVAQPRSEGGEIVARVPPACDWKARSCYDSRASCLLAQPSGGISDPSACAERDQVACFHSSVDLPDMVCSPTMGDCAIARARFTGSDYNRVSECFLVRYEP